MATDQTFTDIKSALDAAADINTEDNLEHSVLYWIEEDAEFLLTSTPRMELVNQYPDEQLIPLEYTETVISFLVNILSASAEGLLTRGEIAVLGLALHHAVTKSDGWTDKPTAQALAKNQPPKQ